VDVEDLLVLKSKSRDSKMAELAYENKTLKEQLNHPGGA